MHYLLNKPKGTTPFVKTILNNDDRNKPEGWELCKFFPFISRDESLMGGK